jgi:MFS transporter, FHS family, glucose/mannose:H+ symporter
MQGSSRVRISLLLNFFVFAILLNTVGIVIERVIADYGATKDAASYLEACKDLTIAGVSFLLASYVPRFGYRRSMIAGLLAVTLASMLVAAVTGFWVTPVLYVVVGASFALMKISVYSTVGLISADQKAHTSFMNVLEGTFQVGSLVGPLLFSTMILLSRWNHTYWIIGTLSALALVLMLATPLPESEIKTEAEQSNFFEMFRLMKHAMVWVFVVCAFLYVMIEQSFGTWMPTFNREYFALTPAQSAAFLSIFAGSIALSRFLTGFLLRHISWLRLISAYLVAAVLLTTLVLTQTVSPASVSPANWYEAHPLAFAFSFMGFFLGPIYPTICSIVLSKLEKVHHSSMTGLIVIFSALGGSAGSRIVGAVSQRLSVHDAFFFPIIPIVLLGLMLIPYKRLSDRFGHEHHTDEAAV